MHPQEAYYTINMILNLLFPRRCVSCNKIGRYICRNCREKISFLKFQICPICRCPSLNGLTHPRCRTGFSLDGIYVPAHYSGPVKKALHLVKYRFVSDLIEELMDILLNNLPVFLIQFDYLVPVPLHPKREKDRGFNQSFLIASFLSKSLKVPVLSHLLLRKKYTAPQFGLKVKERNLNVKDVFQIHDPQKMRNKKIILIDDVATTFSTLKECTKVLKRNGASSVFAVVLAHGN